MDNNKQNFVYGLTEWHQRQKAFHAQSELERRQANEVKACPECGSVLQLGRCYKCEPNSSIASQQCTCLLSTAIDVCIFVSVGGLWLMFSKIIGD